MPKLKKCPSCNGLLEDDGTCSCGWKPKGKAKLQQQRLCAWNDHGLLCGLPGFLSNTTNGEGPWFCRSHFAQLMKWPDRPETSRKPISVAVAEITQDLKEPYQSRAIERQRVSMTAEPMADVDKRVNKLVPRLPGESEHDWSMRCRLWTLDQVSKLSKRFQQEPGANG